ncbi:fimbrial protein [Citrobacter amalonaticus]|uniref:fimbrial protein n=1 Tax=Citrobacter amalonaticus TaxID=35703 RepID=UPI00255B2017|nr:fimbrial protein [Citrobacter amalonaticus]MDL4618422.1 fimbrial protein [Citrobacter amalonaticus]MDL4622520.1 fimbrial protein [Citrobacter amalonaticus]
MLKAFCQITVLLLIFFSIPGHTACRVPNGASKYTYTLSTTLDIPSDASPGPIGNVINIPDGPATSVGCDPGASYGYLAFGSTQSQSNTKDVYKTNVSGIGIKVWDDAFSPTTIIGNSGTKWYTGPNTTLSWSGSWAINHLKMQFYVIGPVAPGNVTLSTPFVKGWISNNPTSGGIVFSQLTITGSARINVPACDIDEALTPGTVALHAINMNALPHQGDVGNNVYFSIGLKCLTATSITMTLTDPNGGDPANGVVFNDAGSGMAKNVGVQVLSARDGGTTPQTVHLNESFTVGQANEGQYTIPMAARYYRTSDEAIVGGKISASVIYELSYQ